MLCLYMYDVLSAFYVTLKSVLNGDVTNADVINADKELQNLGLSSAQGGIFIVPQLPWHRGQVFVCSFEGLT